MKYFSTNHQSPKVTLEKAILTGLASDGGLYLPEKFPQLSSDDLKLLKDLKFKDLALFLAEKLFEDVERNVLKIICDKIYNFKVPLVEIDKGIFSLELFHGPTGAFKDFGASFMSGLVGYFAKKNNQKITVLVATSGDTGGAVANGFYGVENVEVVILYPKGKVSPLQERQLTTLGGNIIALEVDGVFDDCQSMVKQAFRDDELKDKLNLVAANSINIARLLPQMFYQVKAYLELSEKFKKIYISVPSGNFGNLTSGLIAQKMGVEIAGFISPTNINDTFPKYLQTGIYSPQKSVQTISNAMDVGDPSNFVRILEIFAFDLDSVRRTIKSTSYTDGQVKEVILRVYQDSNYLLDPHGAIGYLGLKDNLKLDEKTAGIFLETASPAKFSEVVEPIINQKIEMPKNLQRFMNGEINKIKIKNQFQDLKEILVTLR